VNSVRTLQKTHVQWAKEDERSFMEKETKEQEKEAKKQKSIKIKCSTNCLITSNHKQSASVSSTHAATKTSP
jgi:hypothetical protein